MTINNFVSKIWISKFKFWAFFILLLSFFIYSLITLDFFNFNNTNFQDTFREIKSLFSFKSHDPELSKNLWIYNLELLWETIVVVTSATFFSFVFAFLSSVLSFYRLYKFKLWGAIFRFICIVLRAFPILLVMTFFDEFIISRAFLAFWIYFWFTWLWVHRYFVELLDATNLRRYWLSRKLGKGFIYSFYYYVFLVNKNKYFMNFLFSYESNIRWSAILGSIGIFGIGSLFKNYQSDSSYLGITVLFLMLTIFSFELILFLFNRFLSSQKGFYKKEQVFSKSLRYNWQKYLFWGFFAIILFLVIFSFWKISKLSEGQAIFNAQQFQKSFKTLFSLNFEDVTKNPKIYLVYFDMLKQSYVALVFGTLWAIVFAYNASEKISLWFNSLGHKFLLSLIKAVPILIFFRLINPLLATQAAITLALSISVFRSLVKQIISGINSLSQKQLSSLKKLYGSKFKMYYNFVLPHLYKLIRGNFIFEIENTYRNALNYSLFTGIGVYSRISYYQKYDNDHYIFAYLFPAFLFFLIIELSLWFIKEKQIFSQLLLPIIRLKQKQQE